jgi:hypothetical protein
MNAAHDFLTRVGMKIDVNGWAVDDDVLDLFDDVLEGDLDDDIGERWLRELFERNHHVVQLSEPAPVLAATVDEALDKVSPHVLIEPRGRRRRLTKWRLISDLNLRFLEAGLEPGDNLARGAPLVASGPHGYSHVADYVVIQDQAVQVVQAWSFQVSSQVSLLRDVKAWGWTMRELIAHGGSAETRQGSITIPQNVRLSVVVAPPQEGEPEKAYVEANAVFGELGASVYKHGNEAVVANEAARQLGLA